MLKKDKVYGKKIYRIKNIINILVWPGGIKERRHESNFADKNKPKRRY